MTEQQDATAGWFARRREHRRAKRQQALERRYFEHERAGSMVSTYTSADNHARRADSYRQSAWPFFGGGGGDGGGCGDGGG